MSDPSPTPNMQEGLNIVDILDTIICAYEKNENFASSLSATKQFWRFSVMACNKATQSLGKETNLIEKVGVLALKGLHPLEALTQSFGCIWERIALRHYIVTKCEIFMNEGLSLSLLADDVIKKRKRGSFATSFYGHNMRTTKAEAQKLFPSCTSYTYQFARIIKIGHTSRPTIASVNGEALKRVFVCMPDVKSSLDFVSAWSMSQKKSGEASSCMLECGTHDQTLRKWVLDVDASISDLRDNDGLVSAEGLLPSKEEVEFMHGSVLEMASEISQWMYKMEYLHEPCSFAVTSRHSKVKMSWHITLHALTYHDLWRDCMFKLDDFVAQASKKSPKWIMYKYVDGSTKRNSKSQYMQIIGSTKVKPGCEHDGNFFKREGLFHGNGTPMYSADALSDDYFYAATSMVIHDPWSMPFKCQKDSLVAASKKRKLKVMKRAESLQDDCGGLASWNNVPVEQQKWMRHFIDGSSAADLRSIPTMTQAKNWCDDVMRLVNTGRGTLLLYAYINNAAVCPRFLKIQKCIHSHQHNNCMLMCVKETHPSCTVVNYRMFMRCFSLTCKALKSPQYAPGWIEVVYDDYLKFKELLLPAKV